MAKTDYTGKMLANGLRALAKDFMHVSKDPASSKGGMAQLVSERPLFRAKAEMLLEAARRIERDSR